MDIMDFLTKLFENKLDRTYNTQDDIRVVETSDRYHPDIPDNIQSKYSNFIIYRMKDEYYSSGTDYDFVYLDDKTHENIRKKELSKDEIIDLIVPLLNEVLVVKGKGYQIRYGDYNWVELYFFGDGIVFRIDLDEMNGLNYLMHIFYENGVKSFIREYIEEF